MNAARSGGFVDVEFESGAAVAMLLWRQEARNGRPSATLVPRSRLRLVWFFMTCGLDLRVVAGLRAVWRLRSVFGRLRIFRRICGGR